MRIYSPLGHSGQVLRYDSLGKYCCHSVCVKLRPETLHAQEIRSSVRNAVNVMLSVVVRLEINQLPAELNWTTSCPLKVIDCEVGLVKSHSQAPKSVPTAKESIDSA